jgi:hypothetical protein
VCADRYSAPPQGDLLSMQAPEKMPDEQATVLVLRRR